MGHYVGVAVSVQAGDTGNGDPAENERPARSAREAVDVEALTDAEGVTVRRRRPRPGLPW
jgi:hypothetical protein